MSPICKFCSLCENNKSLLSMHKNKYTTTLHSTTFTALPTLTRTQVGYICLLFFPLNFSFTLPRFVSISLFLSLCLSLSLSLSFYFCLCLFLCPFLSAPHAPHPRFCLFLFVSGLSISLFLSVSVSLCFFFVCLSLSPRFCLFLFFCLRFCLSV